MKVNIANGDLQDYLNIPSVQDLELVKSNSADEILCPFIFNSIRPDQINLVLKVFFDRLRYNGALKIGGYDVVEFSKMILLYQIPMEKRQEIIFNSQNFFSLEEVTSILESCGFNIITRKLDGMYFFIEANK